MMDYTVAGKHTLARGQMAELDSRFKQIMHFMWGFLRPVCKPLRSSVFPVLPGEAIPRATMKLETPRGHVFTERRCL